MLAKQKGRKPGVCAVCGSERYFHLPDEKQIMRTAKRHRREITAGEIRYPARLQNLPNLVCLLNTIFLTLPVLNQTAAGLLLLLFLFFCSQSPMKIKLCVEWDLAPSQLAGGSFKLGSSVASLGI